MNGMTELARAIVGGGTSPRSSEHFATVLRRGSDGTYWVHIPGGADETPISSYMAEASEGDTVRVSISGGKATMTGNVTSPSANVRTVTKVGGIANMALTTAYSESARIDRLVSTSLTADSAIITELQADTEKVHDLSADQLSTAVGYIGDLTALDVTADDIYASTGQFIDIETNYLRTTKHGYELSVVGESERTARYLGIKVPSVIIRTAALSGAICGLTGLLLVAGTNHTITTSLAAGRGFTAVMVSWMSKFNTATMLLTSFLLVFLERGAGEIATVFELNTSFSDILTGIILFFIIGSEFFISYRIVFKSRHSTKEAK